MHKAGAVFLVAMLLLFGITLDGRALTPPNNSEVQLDRAYWQYEVETRPDVVRLLIRDQAGQVGAYNAVFVITGPDKQQYRYQKKGSGSSALAVSFPNDFGAKWTKGSYTWTCAIGGRELLHGAFEYQKACQIQLLQANFSRERASAR